MSEPVEMRSPDHLTLTEQGAAVLTTYARAWLFNVERREDLERAHPDLDGLFYDVRSDVAFASQWAA